MAECFGCKFAPGTFKQRITIQTLSQTIDDTGGSTTVWNDFATLWSKITPKHGNEQLISQRVDAVDIYDITIRYFPGVVEKQRVLYAGKIFQIKSVINIDELSEFMSLLCIDTGPGT